MQMLKISKYLLCILRLSATPIFDTFFKLTSKRFGFSLHFQTVSYPKHQSFCDTHVYHLINHHFNIRQFCQLIKNILWIPPHFLSFCEKEEFVIPATNNPILRHSIYLSIVHPSVLPSIIRQFNIRRLYHLTMYAFWLRFTFSDYLFQKHEKVLYTPIDPLVIPHSVYPRIINQCN